MKKKNNLDAHTRKVLSKILVSNTEAIKKAELIKMIKSDKGKFKGAYNYLIQKFYSDKIISCIDFNKLLDEITKFKVEALLKDFVISKAKKINLINIQILKELEPMEAFQYMKGFLHSAKIGNFLIDFTNKDFVKRIKALETEFKRKVKRADEMTGKKLKLDDKKYYITILNKHAELKDTYPYNSQSSSLMNSIRICCKHCSAKKIKSIHSTILYHLKKGNLP